MYARYNLASCDSTPTHKLRELIRGSCSSTLRRVFGDPNSISDMPRSRDDLDIMNLGRLRLFKNFTSLDPLPVRDFAELRSRPYLPSHSLSVAGWEGFFGRFILGSLEI